MKQIIAIGLITLITSFIWSDMVVFGVFKYHQDYISQNQCIDRNKPMTQCHGNCVLSERLAEPKRNTPLGLSESILLEIKVEFVVEEQNENETFSCEAEFPINIDVDQESNGYLPVLVKPPEVV